MEVDILRGLGKASDLTPATPVLGPFSYLLWGLGRLVSPFLEGETEAQKGEEIPLGHNVPPGKSQDGLNPGLRSLGFPSKLRKPLLAPFFFELSIQPVLEPVILLNALSVAAPRLPL